MSRLLLEHNSLAWILLRETVFSGMGEKSCRPLIAGGQGIAGAFIATLPPERIPPIKDIARRAYLAGGADVPRSFVAVARLAVGRKPIRP
jgi:hypothetical protein